jgi:hypothetical protein
MKAIRIDDKEVLHADQNATWHLDLVREYQAREGLADEAIDAMIDAGRIEFGGSYLVSRNPTKLGFIADPAKGAFYTSLNKIMYECGEP